LFTYYYRGPCQIYYKETTEQKEKYQEMMDKLNDDEIEEEARQGFADQEHDKEVEWTRKGKRFPSKRASFEVY
jgi:hypothetical protein